jgi:hypothetical protein
MQRLSSMVSVGLAACTLASLSGAAHGQTLRTVTRVAGAGDNLGSSGLPNANQEISTINPFVSTDTSGAIAFTGALEDGTNFVWSGSTAVFTTPMALPNVLGTFETGCLGNAPGGKFAFSANVNSNDAIITNAGVLVQEGDPAPSLPGKFLGSSSRPLMTGSGLVTWISSLRNSPTGSNLPDRAFFVSQLGTVASTTARFVTGQSFDGVVLTNTPAQGIYFDYAVANNGLSIHRMRAALDGNTSTPNTEVLVLSNSGAPTVAVRSGTAVPVAGSPGESYFIPAPSTANSAFLAMGINSAGSWVSTANGTIGGALLRNGEAVIRSGDTLDNIILQQVQTNDRGQAVGINEAGNVVVVWRLFDFGTGSGRNHVFASASGTFTDAKLLLAEGDQLDWTGDNVSDGVIATIPTALHRMLDLADDGTLTLVVRVTEAVGGNTRDAVIRVPLPPSTISCDSIDFNADGLFPDDNDLVQFLSVLAGGPCDNDPNCNDIDFNNDGLFPDDSDLITFLRVLAGGPCVE